MHDDLEIPAFLRRKLGESRPSGNAPSLPTIKPANHEAMRPRRRKRRKSSEQVIALRRLGFPPGAITRLTEEQATIAIRKSAPYKRTRRVVTTDSQSCQLG